MMAAWLSSIRRRSQRQVAASLAEWLESVERILEDCSRAIASQPPPDSGILLDAIDRALLRFNQCASEARGALRRSHPQLAGQLQECTDLTYRLRNHTRTFLLRAADVLILESHHGLVNARAAASLDRARQQASESAGLLRRELAALTPDIRRLIADWLHPE